MMPFDLQNPVGSTPLDDISGLKLNWVTTREMLDAAEADNIRLASHKYLLKWCNWRDIKYRGQASPLDPIEIAARVHHRLVWIHPYENGNGRHGRYIGDMVLRAFGLSQVSWPRLNDNGKERKRYIQALQEADTGDFTPLIAFLKQYP